jgi:hypothetical protein
MWLILANSKGLISDKGLVKLNNKVFILTLINCYLLVLDEVREKEKQKEEKYFKSHKKKQTEELK